MAPGIMGAVQGPGAFEGSWGPLKATRGILKTPWGLSRLLGLFKGPKRPMGPLKSHLGPLKAPMGLQRLLRAFQDS